MYEGSEGESVCFVACADKWRICDRMTVAGSFYELERPLNVSALAALFDAMWRNSTGETALMVNRCVSALGQVRLSFAGECMVVCVMFDHLV